MQLAISTASYFSKLFTEDSFEQIKKLELKTCEVFLATFYEYTREFCDLLTERSKGLNIYSVHALTNQFEPELFSISPRTRKDAEDLFDKVIGTAQRLNAKYYTFHGPTRLKKKEYNIDYKLIGERLLELNEKANKKNINIAYENVHWTFFNIPQYFEKLRPYCKGISTVLDIKQAMQIGIDYNSFLDVMGDTLVNVHICDYDEKGKLCMPGKGVFDFKKLFSRLREMGYNGVVTIELYADAYSLFDDIKGCIEYLRDIYPFEY